MGLKRTKKKKGKLGSLRSAGGGSSVETSPLRPVHIEKMAPCISGCPQGQNIREMLVTIQLADKNEKDMDEAFKKAWEIFAVDNPFPSVCGRVCPHPCETECNRKDKDGAVAINAMEQFIGDYGLEKGFSLDQFKSGETKDQKVAVLGAGPAGLTCAYHLARMGYKVTVFEAFPKAGGMLRYGIPPYRLPHDILDAEIKRITDMGVELKLDCAVGRDIPYDDVANEYDAVFVGIGAHKGRALRLEGEDAENVLSGAEFLHKANLGEPVEIGKKVVVIGGGDTAIDAARVSLRLGAEAHILYRRTRTEMPAIDEEIEGAEEENVKIDLLVAPVGIVKEGNRATKMMFQRMELGEPDDSGRRRPVPIEGSEFEVEADTFIAAISQEPEFEGLEAVGNSKEWVQADEFMQTKDSKVYGGGDVLNLWLVTGAIYQGKVAAQAIDDNFKSVDHFKAKNPKPVITSDKVRMPFYEDKEVAKRDQIGVEERFATHMAEITKNLDRDKAIVESKRCMSCGLCMECGECWGFCQDQAVVKPLMEGEKYKFKLELCNGCKKCAEQCPCGYIEMHMPGEAPVYDG